MKIAIIGAGAVGKSTVIRNLKGFLNQNDIKVIDEREYFNNEFDNYMKDMKQSAFMTQKSFFAKRLEQCKRLSESERGFMDRHLIDDFLFPHAHMEIGNFTEDEKIQWAEIEKYYWTELSKLNKVDMVFLIRVPYDEIKRRRKERSKTERADEANEKNDIFFSKVNDYYYQEDGILAKAMKTFAKETFILENDNSVETAAKINNILSRKIAEEAK